MSITIEQVEQQDRRLGRHLVHDSASRGFAKAAQIDTSSWHDHSVRIIDPRPNPNQSVGNCTVCAKAMQLNAVGNRKPGRVLNMDWAMNAYVWETANDDIPGQYLLDGSGQDTGSSGLASCKTAQHLGVGGEYNWLFGGVDEVVQCILADEVVSVGTWWYQEMFNPDSQDVIHAKGPKVGGHQYVARRYLKKRDLVGIRCWWGPGYRDVWIARGALGELLADGGDAHTQKSIG